VLERFFFLDDADRDLVAKRRGDHNRLGFVRAAAGHGSSCGAFLGDPLDVPLVVLDRRVPCTCPKTQTRCLPRIPPTWTPPGGPQRAASAQHTYDGVIDQFPVCRSPGFAAGDTFLTDRPIPGP